MKTRRLQAASAHRAAYRKASDTSIAILRKNARPVRRRAFFYFTMAPAPLSDGLRLSLTPGASLTCPEEKPRR